MSWRYEIRTGILRRVTADIQSQFMGGYSGCRDGKNNPAMCTVANLGPIPIGVYRIGDPYDTDTHGPFVLPLTPDAANEMHGRSGFLIHGDSTKEPGTASEGCIIQPRAVREQIHQSGDRELEVVEG